MLDDDSVRRAVRSLAAAELGDRRRSLRLQDVALALARNPDASLPASMVSEARLEACYRLMNNDAVTFDALVESQAEATRASALQEKHVLVLHDTSEMEPKCATTQQVGYLKTKKPGFLLHLSLAIVANDARRPLGVAHAETLSRKKFGTKGNAVANGGAATAKFKDRESARWLRGIEASEQALEGCAPIHVLDREGDSYALLAQLRARESRFVIRCSYDHRNAQRPGEGVEWSKLRSLVETARAVLSRDVAISARRQRLAAPRAKKHNPSREARSATLHVGAVRVTIAAPPYVKGEVQSVELNVVRVWEPEAPAGEEPIEWLLYTREPVSTPEDLERVVDIYRARWLIEEYFKALKTGCAYEEREFESFEALRTLLAMTLPIATELLWLRSRAREAPDAPATEVLSATQLEVLSEVSPRRLPSTPTVGEALLSVAALGGHQRSNGPPGWQVLYRGMKALLMYESGWTKAMQKAREM